MSIIMIGMKLKGYIGGKGVETKGEKKLEPYYIHRSD